MTPGKLRTKGCCKPVMLFHVLVCCITIWVRCVISDCGKMYTFFFVEKSFYMLDWVNGQVMGDRG